MKKRWTGVLALLLALLLLCGCGGASLPAEGREAAKAPIAFEKIVYTRPNLAVLEAVEGEIEALLGGEGNLKRVMDKLDEFYDLEGEAYTMASVANIRNSHDLTDPFYAAEYAASSEILIEIESLHDALYRACAASRYAGQLSEEYFPEGLLDEYGPEQESPYTERLMALLREETELTAEYRALMADPVIEFKGQEIRFYDSFTVAETEEDWLAVFNAYYDKYNALAGEIYRKLLKNRRQQAAELGYDSCAAMYYEQSYARDYSPAEADAFMESVRQILAPLQRRVQAEQSLMETEFDGVEEADLIAAIRNIGKGLGGPAKETADFLTRYRFYDLGWNENKAMTSFEDYLWDYQAPFLFLSPYETSYDYIGVSHEFGHCVETYISYGADRSLDFAECFSQSMQLLALEPLKKQLTNAQAESLRMQNLVGLLDTYTQQCAQASFEREAYALDDPSVEQLNVLYGRMMENFGGLPAEDGVDKSWFEVTHFFEQPFYVIGYPASAGMAAEVYERELQTPGEGYALFCRLIDVQAPGVVGAAEEAGMKNPLSRERVREAADFLEKQLFP